MAHQPRHRAATQRRRGRIAFAALAAAALAGPATAISNTPAAAATDQTWNRLANCESGGDWHINTGNGYYGGVQFTESTWAGYGGGKYAARADLASRAQQIVIAERVLKSQGWGAWPACSQKLGLTAADAQGSSTSPTSTGKLVGSFQHPWHYGTGQRRAHAAPLQAVSIPRN